MNDDTIIEVKNLKTFFYTNQRCNKAINGVSFKIQKGKTLCIVGESGCGKSVTAASIMGLLPRLSRISRACTSMMVDMEFQVKKRLVTHCHTAPLPPCPAKKLPVSS